MAVDVKTLTYLVTLKVGDTAGITRVKRAVKGIDGTMQKTSKTTKGFAENMKRLAGRALMTIPVWLVLRGGVMALMGAVKDLTKSYMDFSKEMGRVSTVTRGGVESLNLLRDAAIRYGSDSSRSLKEAATAMYALGSAGLTVTQQMDGLEHVMNLSVGTFGNTEQTAKLVSGAFNVFGKRMQNATTDAKKFQRISDILAYTYSCYTPDTEVLTDQGWKLFTELNKSEKMATLDMDTFELIYQKPYCYVNQNFEGNLHHIKGRFVDIMVTPNHKLFVNMGFRPVSEKFELIEAKDTWGRAKKFYRGSNWKGQEKKYFFLPKVEVKTSSKNIEKIKMEDWLEFLGWYLSEGYCYGSRVTIYQSNYREKVDSCLKKLPWKYGVYDPSEHGNTGCPSYTIHSKQLAQYLKQFGKSHDKFIPEDIKQLSKRLLRIFIKFYTYGDGSISRKENWGFGISTSSIKMRDDLQEIALKADYGCTYREGIGGYENSGVGWTLSFSERNKFQLKSIRDKNDISKTSNEELIPYKGKVVCVEIPNHVLFVRRNGRSFWCGNTQQVELSEIANAMTYVASIGNLMNIKFEDLVTTIGVLNSGMLKGSKSGTSLMNAFIMLAQKGEKLASLGVIFDPTQPLDFYDVIKQLHEMYGSSALSLNSLKDLMQTFGRRGGRAAAQLISDFDRWKKSIDDTEANFEDFAEMMREKAEDTLPMAFAKLGNSIKVNLIEKLQKAEPLLKGLAKAIEKQQSFEVTYRAVQDYLPDEMMLARGGRGLGQKKQKESVLAFAESNAVVLDALKQIKAEIEDTNDLTSQAVSTETLLERLAERRLITNMSEKQVREEVRRILMSIPKIEKESKEILDKTLEILMEKVGLGKKEIEQKKELLTMEQKAAIKAVARKGEAKLFEAGGKTPAEVSYRELIYLVSGFNEKVAEANIKRKEAGEIELKTVSILDVMNGKYEAMHDIGSKIGGQSKVALKIQEKSLDVLSKQKEEAREYSDALQTEISGTLTDVIMGKGGGIRDIANKMKEIQAEAFTEAFTKSVFADSGFGDMFASDTQKMANAFSDGSVQVYEAHVNGFRDGIALMGESTGGSLGGPSSLRGIASGLGVPIGSIGNRGILQGTMGGTGKADLLSRSWNFPGMGDGGRLKGLIPGMGKGGVFSGGNVLEKLKAKMPGMGKGGLLEGKKLGKAMGQGMAIYNLANMPGQLKGTGNVMGGAMQGAMAGSALGPIGMVVGGLIGAISGGRSKTSTTTETTTSQVTSRIDITNKSLQIVNRNLVALKATFETYILPQSAYFASKNDVESDFSISSRRGVV